MGGRPQSMPRPQERPDGQPQWDMGGRPQPMPRPQERPIGQPQWRTGEQRNISEEISKPMQSQSTTSTMENNYAASEDGLRRFSIVPPEELRELVSEDISLEAQNRYLDRRRDRRDCEIPWLCSLIGVLFNDEIYRRRCRNRRCKRWW
ncbi:MAG: hypothetical protein IKJ01_08820, partial [Lachnospiraceae bacterium]|nr:hypothetical protein [Lachnospiraceae bacterium]